MVEGGSQTGNDVLVIGNRVSDVMWGIYFGGDLGKYRDNVTIGVANPFTGGRDAGNNN